MLEPLESEILIYGTNHENTKNHKETNAENENHHADIFAIKTGGVKVLAYWGKDEVGLTGWRTGKFKNYYLKIISYHLGWYKGTVLTYDEKSDIVDVEFDTEKGIRYKYCIAKDLALNKIKLAKGMERLLQNNEAFFQIGSEVKVYLSKDDITTNNMVEGWYAAGVQSIDYDNDEIDLIFSDNPDQVYTIPVVPNIISKKLRFKQQLF